MVLVDGTCDGGGGDGGLGILERAIRMAGALLHRLHAATDHNGFGSRVVDACP